MRKLYRPCQPVQLRWGFDGILSGQGPSVKFDFSSFPVALSDAVMYGEPLGLVLGRPLFTYHQHQARSQII